MIELENKKYNIISRIKMIQGFPYAVCSYTSVVPIDDEYDRKIVIYIDKNYTKNLIFQGYALILEVEKIEQPKVVQNIPSKAIEKLKEIQEEKKFQKEYYTATKLIDNYELFFQKVQKKQEGNIRTAYIVSNDQKSPLTYENTWLDGKKYYNIAFYTRKYFGIIIPNRNDDDDPYGSRITIVSSVFPIKSPYVRIFIYRDKGYGNVYGIIIRNIIDYDEIIGINRIIKQLSLNRKKNKLFFNNLKYLEKKKEEGRKKGGEKE